MLMKPAHYVKQMRSIWEVFNSDAGEGWRSSVGRTVWKRKKHYIRVKEERIS
jgi:hypothetical protein